MIELLAGVGAAILVVVMVALYERRPTTEWEDLLSPDARAAFDYLKQKAALEERLVDKSREWAAAAESRAEVARLLAASADYVIGLADDRVALVRKLQLYSRIVAAVAPRDERLRLRLSVLRRSFAALAQQRTEVDLGERFKALDQETVEACRVLILDVAGESA